MSAYICMYAFLCLYVYMDISVCIYVFNSKKLSDFREWKQNEIQCHNNWKHLSKNRVNHKIVKNRWISLRKNWLPIWKVDSACPSWHRPKWINSYISCDVYKDSIQWCGTVYFQENARLTELVFGHLIDHGFVNCNFLR